MEQIFQSTEFSSSRNGDYLKATHKGFEFGTVFKIFNRIMKRKAKLLSSIEGGAPQPYKVVLSFGALLVAIVLGLINANNVKQSIASIGVSDDIATAAGFAFTLIGLLIGERLNEGLVLDEFTNKKRPTGKFWGALVGAVLYIGVQVFLALGAGTGVSADMQSTVDFTMVFSLLIALIEIAFGFLFLNVAMQTVGIFLLNARIYRIKRKLKSLAYQTESLWNRYLFNMQKAGIQPEPETEAVRLAREYYANGGDSNFDTNNTND